MESTPTIKRWLELTQELDRARSVRRLEIEYAQRYDDTVDPPLPGPYPKQFEFHQAGAHFMQRAIFAGNRFGKSRTGAAEAAIHATGMYPDWWEGRKFDTPTNGICAAEHSKILRDSIQKELVGPLIPGTREPSGTGWIPKERIVDWSYQMANVRNVLDYVVVKHVSGGESKITFNTYAQGRESFEAVKLHWAWPDEEPPWDIWEELLMRLVDEDGIIWLTRTPLYGYTDLVKHFLDGAPQTWYVMASWYDAMHMTPEKIEKFISALPADQQHTIATRSGGHPLKGGGGVYNVPEDDWILEAPVKIRSWWRHIGGIDFGIAHPFAAAWLAWDPDADIVYLYDEYRAKHQTPQQHVAGIYTRPNGRRIRWTWPHDGYTKDKGTGEQLYRYYRKAGLDMTGFSARFDDDTGGPQSRWQSTGEIQQRMLDGRFKVFPHCTGFIEETRMLHMDDGTPPQIVALNDDIESAVRYAIIMLRHARPLHDSSGDDRLAELYGVQPSGRDKYDPHARWRRS